MYPAVISNLLGRCNSPNSALTKQEFLNKFATYDDGFEYGSQLPDLFLKYVHDLTHVLFSLQKRSKIAKWAFEKI